MKKVLYVRHEPYLWAQKATLEHTNKFMGILNLNVEEKSLLVFTFHVYPISS